MSKSRYFRTKRVRRQANAAVKFGVKAKPRHRSRSGRTGKAFSTKLKSGLRGKGFASETPASSQEDPDLRCRAVEAWRELYT